MFLGDKIETNLPYFYRLSTSNTNPAKLNDPNQCNKDNSKIISKPHKSRSSRKSTSRTNCSNYNRRSVNESNFIQYSNIRIQNNEL